VCTTKLKQACVSCGSPLEPIWQVCPYCETPIEPALPGAPPALGTRRARRTSSR
jgi:predicted amidophosphoribosyltransferase